MHSLNFEITKPTDDSAFEDMCARVYGEVFGDPLPKINGRKGQAQAGVDIFVNSSAGRIGIQCKRYADGRLRFKHVEEETRRADAAGSPIIRLVLATTAASDATLLREVQDFSDARVKDGKYSVEIEFWEDICRHIWGSGRLQNDYAPNAPGAMFHRLDESNLTIIKKLDSVTAAQLAMNTSLPSGRADSVNTFLTTQLDALNVLLKSCRYRDAHEDLLRLGTNLEIFDAHQRARWYLMRGVCAWHLDSGLAAAPDFLKAFELYPADEKIAAAGVRGLLLQGDVEGAVNAGVMALQSFPTSAYVWTAYANALMARGDDLTIASVPLHLRDNCDVLHLLAWARKNVGDLEGAIELTGRALALPDADFFVRAAALAFALEVASADPVKAAYGCVGTQEIAALQRAVTALQPRNERVWSIQSLTTQDTLVHLGYAAIVLGQAEDALLLVDEAKQAGRMSARLMRVALEAYRHLDRQDELVRFGWEWLSQLEEEALIVVAETASAIGDVETVTATMETAKKLATSQPETLAFMTAMRWIALWQSIDGRELALNEVLSANLSLSTSLGLICGGARILFAAGRETEAEAVLLQAYTLVDKTSPSGTRLLLADLLYSTKNYARAIHLYEGLVVHGRFSELHGRLLSCYVATGARGKGRALLQSFPDGWAEDDWVRSLAIELGQSSADWSFLEPLAEVQCAKAPEVAGGWLLRLVLYLHTKKMHRFHQTLDTVPMELKGAHRQIAQIAALELRWGDKSAGLKRLYRLFRNNMDECEAASAYFIGIIEAHGTLPGMDESIDTVVAGTTVELQDEHGRPFFVSIDPTRTAPLPIRDNFFPVDSKDLAPLIGQTVGASVELPGPLSTQRQYIVRSVTSVYRHLLKLAQARIETSMCTQGHVVPVPIPKTATGADFGQMHALLKRRSMHSKQVLATYATGPLTLGILAKLLGVNVVEFPTGWAMDGPQLFVGLGTHEEQSRAAQLLQRPQADYVIDAVTIAELVQVNGDQALAALPKVLISTKAMELLLGQLEAAQLDQSAGQISEVDGEMRFITSTPESKMSRLTQFKKMVDVARKYCETVPSYGPVEISKELEDLGTVLQDEEYSALLLAVERNATLLTVDGHLAQLAATAIHLNTVWPQALLKYAAEIGAITGLEYTVATARQFLGNRSFISIGRHDLVFLCLQGGFALRVGIQRFKDYLSSPATDFQSAAGVMFEFLKVQSCLFAQFKAFTELLSHLVEAALRHPACSKEIFMLRIAIFVRHLLENAAGPKSSFPLTEKLRSTRIDIRWKLCCEALQLAENLARNPVKPRVVKLKTIMGTVIPKLAFDSAISESEPAIAKEGDEPPWSTLAEAPSPEDSVHTEYNGLKRKTITSGTNIG